MSDTIRFCFVLHNHQPVGNFDDVFEAAYRDSYLPFLDVFEQFPGLRMSLHVSGSLIEWLDSSYPEYVDRLAGYMGDGRIELLGGAFYEPILTMLPSRDRVGQITAYTRWLEKRLHARIQGMWVPERVWEPSLTSDLAAAGIKYTVLDDFHFQCAGLAENQLDGYYLTEDEGNLLAIFPGSERLRYLIPFRSPEETIDHLRRRASERPGSLAIFADDGEKLGTWPDTKRHVYEDGWLARFFELLMANQDWIHTTTLSEVFENVSPIGKIYLPEASYREMTEWALPVDRQVELERARHDLKDDARWQRIGRLMRSGFWRNFKVKYPEANEMYARMTMVSRRLQAAREQDGVGPLIDAARTELYRGQCNCGYWHGAFGGIYLPHLRGAVYRHLIAADNLLDQADGRSRPWVDATAADFNFDARQEVKLDNDKLLVLIAPAIGGRLYELDVRSIAHNLLATLTRRPEAYHQKVLAGADQSQEDVASSIHDRVVFKQEGLDRRLQYDRHEPKSLLDHFYDDDVTLDAVAGGQAVERGDFLNGSYETTLRRKPDRIQVQLVRQGTVCGVPLTITKGVTLEAGSSALEIAYLLEGLPQDRPLIFGIEFNFAGLPAGEDDRQFYSGEQEHLGHLGGRLDLDDRSDLGLVDRWLGIDVRLVADLPARFWTFPVETVSQSEGGFELVHQSVVVEPHWLVRGDADGRWSVTLTLEVDTSLAESRTERPALAASP